MEITQQQVADKLNIDRSTYSYYETGRSAPTLETLNALARLFRVTVDDLINGSKNGITFRTNPPDYTTKSDDWFASLDRNEQNIVLYYRLLSDENKEKAKDILKEMAKEMSASEK